MLQFVLISPVDVISTAMTEHMKAQVNAPVASVAAWFPPSEGWTTGPSYVQAVSNCIVTQSPCVVCRSSEGEELLGQVEARVNAPVASVEALLRFVEGLTKGTQPRAGSIELHRHPVALRGLLLERG